MARRAPLHQSPPIVFMPRSLLPPVPVWCIWVRGLNWLWYPECFVTHASTCTHTNVQVKVVTGLEVPHKQWRDNTLLAAPLSAAVSWKTEKQIIVFDFYFILKIMMWLSHVENPGSKSKSPLTYFARITWVCSLAQFLSQWVELISEVSWLSLSMGKTFCRTFTFWLLGFPSVIGSQLISVLILVTGTFILWPILFVFMWEATLTP